MSRIKRFFSQRSLALEQFPVAHVLLAFLSAIGIILVRRNSVGDDATSTGLINMLLAGTFAFFLSLAGPIYLLAKKIAKKISTPHTQQDNHYEKQTDEHSAIETKPKGRIFSWVFQILAVLAGRALFLSLPPNIDRALYSTQMQIFGALFLSFLLLFIVIGLYFRKSEGITRTARTSLIESIIIGGVAGLIVWGGISAALKAIDYLFNAQIDYTYYQYMGWIAMVFVCGSISLISYINLLSQHSRWFGALSKSTNEDGSDTSSLLPKEDVLPRQRATEDADSSHRILKIFGQYIFLPLTIIYALILVSYSIKIVLTAMRPEGTVAYMVLGYTGFALLTRYTTYPFYRNDSFIRKTHHALFASFMVAAALLFAAMYIRTKEYGITIDRALIYYVGGYIFIVGLFGLLRPKNRLLLISLGLCVFSLYALYTGPTSASGIASNNQRARLINALIEHNVQLPLGSGSLSSFTQETSTTTTAIPAGCAKGQPCLRSTPDHATVQTPQSIDAYSRIATPLFYLIKNHNPHSWARGILSEDKIEELRRSAPYNKIQDVCSYVGLQNCNYYGTREARSDEYFYYSAQSIGTPINIAGYSLMTKLEDYDNPDNDQSSETVSKNLPIDLTNYLEDIALQSQRNNSSPYIIETNNEKIIITNLSGKKKRTQGSGFTYSWDYVAGYKLTR